MQLMAKSRISDKDKLNSRFLQINQYHTQLETFNNLSIFYIFTYSSLHQTMDSSSRIALPSSNEQKEALKQSISQYIQHLQSNVEEQLKLVADPHSKQIVSIQEKISTLQMRLKLIDRCSEFSLLRLNHLEEIFKYYCTHIFKIGKHMTFDRLEYEREHLNTERFFLFLRDFNLTTAQIDGKPRQLIPKTTIMTIFKKISSNSRDLTFQEFIKCLQKIAVIYFDEKTNYWRKIEEQKLERIKRKKEIERRKIKRMKMNGQKVDENVQKQLQRLQQQEKQASNKKQLNNQQQQQISPQNEDKQQQNQQSGIKKAPKLQQNSQPEQQNNQNDDLIKQMMQDQNLEDPNQQINQITNKKKLESMQIEKTKKNKSDYEKKLLTLTNNQKIQFFYQMIGVDSVKQYKNKLTVLNMPLFHKDKKQSTQKPIDNNKSKTIHIDDSANLNNQRSKSQEDQQRLHKLKEKLNQKKEKLKNQPIPKPKEQKQSETAKQRRLMKEQRELRMIEKLKEKQQQNDALKQKAKDAKKNPNKTQQQQQNSAPLTARPTFNQKQVNWQMLEKMNFDQLKLRQFHPTKLYNLDEDDYIFMQEYGEFKQPNRRASRMEVRERQSLSIVENVRKRANEVQKSERKEETKLNGKVGAVGRQSFKGKL